MPALEPSPPPTALCQADRCPTERLGLCASPHVAERLCMRRSRALAMGLPWLRWAYPSAGGAWGLETEETRLLQSLRRSLSCRHLDCNPVKQRPGFWLPERRRGHWCCFRPPHRDAPLQWHGKAPHLSSAGVRPPPRLLLVLRSVFLAGWCLLKVGTVPLVTVFSVSRTELGTWRTLRKSLRKERNEPK